jgi:EAL domain-containing protein (putative c-di-GMP-specific phosphodiesterase class I)
VRERLVALGVDFAQGYAIHRPEPLADWFARPA